MGKISHKLSRKLSIGIMLLAIPIFVLSLGFFYYQSLRLIRQEAVKDSNSILQTTLMHVRGYMGSIETSTSANAWMLEEYFTPDSLESISRRIVALNPHVLSCSVCTTPEAMPQYQHGFSVYTIEEDGAITTTRETEYDYFDKEWYKTPVTTGKAGWVEPFSRHTEGTIDHNEAVATYCQPLRSETGQIIGVLAIDFSFKHLAKTINNAERTSPHAYFVLTGDKGRFFVHPDTTKLFRKTIYTDADPRLHADRIALGYEMAEGKQGTGHVMVNDTLCHVCYHPVPGTDWSLALVCPDSEVLTGYRKMGAVIIGLIFLGLLAILWLTNHVVKQTISPIHQLLETTQLIADGNYDAAIPLSHQNDDIGRLQNSFAIMQQKLSSHMGSIHDAADAIKRRNEQRSRDMKLAEETIQQKNSFVQNLSHQIRTPLNIIIGFANVLNENINARSKGTLHDPFEEENTKDITRMMKHNAIHLKRMIIMLFDCSSTTGEEELMRNRNEEMSCNEVARASIDYTLELFTHRVNIQFDTELPDGMMILSNRLYVMRIIRELLVNAAKYSDGRHISLHVSQTESSVRFTIQDTGPGLDGDVDELLLKPFVKIDELSDGLGIGLALTKRHCMSLGGDLIYDAYYKDGCRFIVILPK
ncbi:MAG: HAMP domain-containing protein [Prevotella sp.]|nr:HAMP domain-containing protein [Prevotella sp.]